MKWVLAVVLLGHGLAHLVGFLVPFRLMEDAETPYKTTLLCGRWDVGDRGIRLNGVLWLLVSLGFFAATAALLMGASFWFPTVLLMATASTMLSIIGLPDAKIGVVVNLVLIVGLLIGRQWGWLTVG